MDSHTIDQFLQLEDEVWAALASGDMAADRRLLADDFLGVYSDGFAGKAEHADQLRDGPTVAYYELSKARLKVLSKETVLLSYLAQWARQKGQVVGDREAMYVTSIWQYIDGSWQNVFSQDTPVGS